MNPGILFQELHYIHTGKLQHIHAAAGKAMRTGLFPPDHLKLKEATGSLTVEELGDLPQLPTAQTSSETSAPALKQENASFQQPSHEQIGNNFC